jgi:hypothetical protein
LEQTLIDHVSPDARQIRTRIEGLTKIPVNASPERPQQRRRIIGALARRFASNL